MIHLSSVFLILTTALFSASVSGVGMYDPALVCLTLD